MGLRIEDLPLAKQLASSFDEMFERADFRHKRFMRLRKFGAKKTVTLPAEQILFSGPGRGRSPFKQSLRQDLARARDVRIVMAYFLPTWRLRQVLDARGAAGRSGAIDSGGQIRRAAGPARGAEFVPAVAGRRRGDLRIPAANPPRETHHRGRHRLYRFQQPRRAQPPDQLRTDDPVRPTPG